MKAMILTQYGTPDVLQLEEIERPSPQKNEILIQIRAASVGYGDLVARNLKNLPPRDFNMAFPLWLATRLFFGIWKPRVKVLGAEFSGIVVEVGSGVTRFKKGEAVFGYRGPAFGSHAEYLCVNERGLVAPKPQGMTFEEAACLPYGAITALSLLKKASLQPGQRVLILGASGAIGSFALQLAKAYGAEVTGVCGTRRMDVVRALGADEVLDYTKDDPTVSKKRYDVILDVLGRSSFSRYKDILTDRGLYLMASFKTPNLFQMLWTSFGRGKRVICALSSDSLPDLFQAKTLAESGRLKVLIDRSFPLEALAEAHRYLEASQQTGRVVITFGGSR